MNRRKNGFTLVELLATVVIITLVMGIASSFVIRVINNSNNKSRELALNNVKTGARYYVTEYSQEVAWTDEEDQFSDPTGNSFTCVTFNSLINKGYFNINDVLNLSEYKQNKEIIVRKDSNKNIYNEEFDYENKIASIELINSTDSKYQNIMIDKIKNWAEFHELKLQN